ncbi:hypothetical protein DFH08DRAFT_974880 [Mycena albidolilacea]|uniref:Uncharacterized protein n=1 Tax=Mycena albidolilacea TaxID=1033008 RepID=A0AAD6Z6R0_9AGAR|nr:hypothetical protein DFH08DRAFT_974880 [Mycena albidolilacea]
MLLKVASSSRATTHYSTRSRLLLLVTLPPRAARQLAISKQYSPIPFRVCSSSPSCAHPAFFKEETYMPSGYVLVLPPAFLLFIFMRRGGGLPEGKGHTLAILSAPHRLLRPITLL